MSAFNPDDPNRLAFDERDHKFLTEHRRHYGHEVTIEDARSYVPSPVPPSVAALARELSIAYIASEVLREVTAPVTERARAHRDKIASVFASIDKGADPYASIFESIAKP